MNYSQLEFPKMQILTIKDLLENKKPIIPLGMLKSYYKEAQEVIIENDRQSRIGDF